jgi:hypothetical protein
VGRFEGGSGATSTLGAGRSAPRKKEFRLKSLREVEFGCHRTADARGTAEGANTGDNTNGDNDDDDEDEHDADEHEDKDDEGAEDEDDNDEGAEDEDDDEDDEGTE